jgi:cobalt-zinc-cadmium efflux system membrane fusion protein
MFVNDCRLNRGAAKQGKVTGVAIVACVLAILVAMFSYRPLTRWIAREESPSVPKEQPLAELVPEIPNTLRLQHDVIDRLGIKTAAASEGKLPQTLELAGTLSLDPTRLQEVRSRFDGEIVELGKTSDGSRALQYGDNVRKGQLVAVLWSPGLGETKSKLVEALVQLNTHATTLDHLKGLSADGAIALREYREMAEAVETDRNAVARHRRTLETWRVADAEIQAVEAEAKRLIGQDGSANSESQEQWARAEIFAALDGVILEQNAVVGDNISTNDVLFKIADLTRLRVIANAYEEDLPKLDALPPDARTWHIVPTAEPTAAAVRGSIEQISRLIDPVQHTGAVLGWVDNKTTDLRAGQFVSVKVDLPIPENEVVVPSTAIVEQGHETLLFVQQPDDPVFTRRKVALSRQVGDSTCVLSKLPAAADPTLTPLKPGEEVVVAGAVELEQVLIDLQSEQPASSPAPEAAQ